MRFPSRLEGGPFDGDHGYWHSVEELPACFWAVGCNNPECEANGVHWILDPIEAAKYGGEKYVYDRVDDHDENMAVYIHANLDYDGILRGAEEHVEA